MKLKTALKKKKFVVTSEVQTPVDQEPEELVRSLSQARGRVDGVSLSEVELEGIVGDTIKTCELLNQSLLEPITQTTTRDKNRLQLQKDLIDAHDAGIDNLLVFTEDYRLTGDSLQEIGTFFHVDAGKLDSVLEHIRQGETVEGDSLKSKADFLLGSGIESSWGKKCSGSGNERNGGNDQNRHRILFDNAGVRCGSICKVFKTGSNLRYNP